MLVRHGRFAMDHPFMTLPNVIASPHDSASVPAMRPHGMRLAIANARCALDRALVHNLVTPADRYL